MSAANTANPNTTAAARIYKFPMISETISPIIDTAKSITECFFPFLIFIFSFLSSILLHISYSESLPHKITNTFLYKNVAIYNIGQTNTGSSQDLSGGNFTVIAPSGWYSLKGIWYYVDPTTNTLKKGWLLYNGYWYFLDQNGAMKSGWQSIDNHWYYLTAPSGDMQVGWKQLDGKWYYLNNSGVMQTGWVSTGGKWYYFYDSGEMAHDTYVNGYWLGSDGAWVQ